MKSFKNISADSILEKEYLKYLKNKNIKVISFDIFETLAYRKVKRENGLFKKVAKKKFVKDIFFTKEGFVSARIEAEKRARKLNSKKEDITLELIYKQLPLSKEQQIQIINIELETEYKSLYINLQIKRWIKLANKYNKEIILISDTYFSLDNVKYLILSKLKKPLLISNIYISNEHNLTKATGNLYQKVLKDLKIKPSELLHIGDNKYSDIQMAKQKHINTIYYGCDNYLKEVFDLESSYIPSLDKNHNYRVQSSLLNPYDTEEEKLFFNLGASIFGPILWEFSHWVKTLAKKNNISQVNYVMREGRIFQKYISQISSDLELNLIYASRKSTFLPSIEIENIQKDGFNFYTYRELTVQGLYDLFRLKIKNKHIKEYSQGLLKEQTILLEDISNDIKSRMNKIKKNILYEKELFTKYMEQQNYKNDSIIIDFGGSGSILKNIENILSTDKPKNINLLFYAHSGALQKMQKSKIVSFLPLNSATNKEIELIRRNHEFIEILFNGFNSTTLHYTKHNNLVKPMTMPNNKAMELNKSKLYAFDNGVDSFFTICKKHNLKDKLYSRKNLLLMLSRLIEVPTIHEACGLGDLYHDENYTDSTIEKLISIQDIKTIKKIGIENSFYKSSINPSFKINAIPWVQGTITQLNNNYIKNIKSLATKGVNTDSIATILEILDENQSIKEIYLYGAGELFKELFPHLQKRKIRIKALIDARAKVSNFSINSFKVKSIDNILFKDGDCIVVSSVVFATDITNTIIKNIQNKKIKIINFYNNLIEIN